MKKKKRVPQQFDVRRASDGVKVFGPIYAYAANQAVGYYVKIELQKPWDKKKYYATKHKPEVKKSAVSRMPKIKRVSIRIAGACPNCGYVDPQRDQASCCPNCQ